MVRKQTFIFLTLEKILIILFSVVFGQQVYAQSQTVTLSGTVRDSKNGEALPGLTVTLRIGEKQLGATSNAYGFYSISTTLHATDSATVYFTYVGYESITQKIKLDKDILLNMELKEEGTVLQEVVITDQRLTDAVNSTQMSSARMSIAQIKRIPVLFGEIDLMKVIQLMPGIKSGNEGFSGFYVRGGSNDQNLILLDEATVYNASHIGGLFSVFNPDAVKGLEVYKGNFPANYGGRLSSVLDVQLKEGNRKKYSVSGGIGIISSRLTFEGPIRKGKGSFILSGRRTYFDLFTSAINNANKNDPNYDPIPAYYFYDLNLKANYDLGINDRIFLSGYFGRDVFGFRSGGGGFTFDFYWGNVTSTLRWNHIFHDKLFSNTSVTYSNYQYNLSNSITAFNFNLYSKISDISAKVDFDWFANVHHAIKFGAVVVNHTFTPSGFSFDNATASISTSFVQTIGGNEGALYFADDYEVTQRLKINYGLRASGFRGSRSDTVALYGALEPRMSARYKLNENWAVKASYARMVQYVHLASSSTASLPTDVWYPSTNRTAPEFSDQVAFGITKIIPKWGITITSESYYKWLYNQIELRNGAQIFANPNVDQEFAFGKGWGYGTELTIEKKEGRFTGWIGYTLSWAYRRFKLDPEQQGPEVTFPFRFDRRHDISIVGMYDISKRAQITVTWVFRTGDAVTIPQNRVVFNDLPGVRKVGVVEGQFYIGGIVPNYGDRNAYRMPPSHRMDVSFTWKFKPRHGQSDLNISIYNFYNNRNPFFFYIDSQPTSAGAPTSFQAKLLSLFPVIPSVTYNFKF